jgi:hypothetical protein
VVNQAFHRSTGLVGGVESNVQTGGGSGDQSGGGFEGGTAVDGRAHNDTGVLVIDLKLRRTAQFSQTVNRKDL